MSDTAKRNVVVITTINPPGDASRAYAQLPNWHTVVVGDRKSPIVWHLDGATYLPVEPKTSSFAVALPENHYSRKMLGYLAAVRIGATIIAETDDDNVPKQGWSFPAFRGEYQSTLPDLGFVNTYRCFTQQHIWPRGLPLPRVLDSDSLIDLSATRPADATVGVWQGLADGDPDVDAIYRLTIGQECIFEQRPPLVLGRGTISPFNSQNTAFCAELFPLLYLPSTVTFRFTDILRGYVAQPVMWSAGYQLGFVGASVTQIRNPHDYMRDFESEIPCYLDVERCIDLVTANIRPELKVAENLILAYEALTDAGITQPHELTLLGLWLEELASARNGSGRPV